MKNNTRLDFHLMQYSTGSVQCKTELTLFCNFFIEHTIPHHHWLQVLFLARSQGRFVIKYDISIKIKCIVALLYQRTLAQPLRSPPESDSSTLMKCLHFIIITSSTVFSFSIAPLRLYLVLQFLFCREMTAIYWSRRNQICTSS